MLGANAAAKKPAVNDNSGSNDNSAISGKDDGRDFPENRVANFVVRGVLGLAPEPPRRVSVHPQCGSSGGGDGNQTDAAAAAKDNNKDDDDEDKEMRVNAGGTTAEDEEEDDNEIRVNAGGTTEEDGTTKNKEAAANTENDGEEENDDGDGDNNDDNDDNEIHVNHDGGNEEAEADDTNKEDDAEEDGSTENDGEEDQEHGVGDDDDERDDEFRVNADGTTVLVVNGTSLIANNLPLTDRAARGNDPILALATNNGLDVEKFVKEVVVSTGVFTPSTRIFGVVMLWNKKRKRHHFFNGRAFHFPC
jgi:hypothetical protein